ncbi:MAG TPA: SAM-dependent methyltransferase [Pseudonocardiaceae bacterium]|jgi:SAM-dependent methyltransferase
MTKQRWASLGIDVDQPNPARIYDYMLGGGHNFAADRAAAEQIEALLPGARAILRCNRAFLRRAVLFLISAGVRQFLDIGSGVPTIGNVHEIAQRADEQARVVYVDKEPVAVAHSRLLLADNQRAAAVQADMCEPDTVLRAPETRRLLNLDEPIGLLTVAVIHFIADEQRPPDVMAAYRDQLAPGSYLALSHGDSATGSSEVAEVMELYKRSGNPVYPRSPREISALFAGFDLVEPGVVSAAQWQPESPSELGPQTGHSEIYAGVGRKP